MIGDQLGRDTSGSGRKRGLEAAPGWASQSLRGLHGGVAGRQAFWPRRWPAVVAAITPQAGMRWCRTRTGSPASTGGLPVSRMHQSQCPTQGQFRAARNQARDRGEDRKAIVCPRPRQGPFRHENGEAHHDRSERRASTISHPAPASFIAARNWRRCQFRYDTSERRKMRATDGAVRVPVPERYRSRWRPLRLSRSE